MRKAIAIVSLFVAGFVCGGFLASHVWLVSTRALRESSRFEYVYEQEFLASRARRSGDRFREVVHRLNVADAQAELGFRWLQRSRNASYGSWLKLPWESYLLASELEGGTDSDAYRAGSRRVEALYRGRAAMALERFGAPELAEDQWATASALSGTAREVHRRLDAPSFPTVQADLEAAYLDTATYAEHHDALDGIREKLDQLRDPD